MRFMMLYKPGKESDAPPSQQEMADLGQLIEEMAKTGVLIATDGLHMGEGASEIRLMHEAPAFGPEFTPEGSDAHERQGAHVGEIP